MSGCTPDRHNGPALNIAVVSGHELSAGQRSAWVQLQAADGALASPFFHPEFTAAVASVRDDVHVALLEQAGAVVGFFPFQRGAGGAGLPVGAGRSNYHGVIAARGLRWDARQLMRHCGLRVWDFDHLIAAQAPFAPFHSHTTISYVIDLSNGFGPYLAAQRANGSRTVQRLREKARRFEREVGPLHFEPNERSGAALDALMRWKSAQYRRTGEQDRFAVAWNVGLLREIHARQTDGFAGMLAVLYAGDTLAAAVMGMRAGPVFHWWFPAYDPAFARYSPGLVLLLKLVEGTDELGLRIIDLGKDHALYKERWANASVPLAEGSVATDWPMALRRRARAVAVGALRGLALERPARRALRRLRGGL